MSFNVGRELQKHLYGKLTADVPLMALIQGVYDFIPQSEVFPFVHIGSIDFNKQTSMGSLPAVVYSATVQIDIWHRPNPVGKAKVWDLINEVRRVLHLNRDFAPTEFCLLVFDEELSQVIVEPDTVTYHGVMRFRAVLGGRE